MKKDSASPSIMVLAGETSGDRLAAELIEALREVVNERGVEKTYAFFGAGGEAMEAVGVEMLMDMTAYSVVGLWEVAKKYFEFRRIFDRLLKAALERRPSLVILVDFSGFNRRFASALRAEADWELRIVYYVSPQVWASRPGRVRTMERDLDLLLSVFPFEKAWYQEHAPRLSVEYVGHPMVDRYRDVAIRELNAEEPYTLALLPGSRLGECRRHIPLILDALDILERSFSIRPVLVLPTKVMMEKAKAIWGDRLDKVELRIGALRASLEEADLALACTGTVTLECAFCRIPTVTFYQTSLLTYWVARRIVRVKWLTMPNILADEEIFPELIQYDANPKRLAEESTRLLTNLEARYVLREKLGELVKTLGEGGGPQKAARMISGILVPVKAPRA